MRGASGRLTPADLNAAIRKHLSTIDQHVVVTTRDAHGLRDAPVSDAFSPTKYDATRLAELLDDGKVISARKLGIRAENVTITPVEEVFRR